MSGLSTNDKKVAVQIAKEISTSESWDLPVDDHGGVLVLGALPDLLEQEVVDLRVPVHQSHQLLNGEDFLLVLE